MPPTAKTGGWDGTGRAAEEDLDGVEGGGEDQLASQEGPRPRGSEAKMGR